MRSRSSLGALTVLMVLAVGAGCGGGSDAADAPAPTTSSSAEASQQVVEVRVEQSTVPEALSGELEGALAHAMEKYGVPGAVMAVELPDRRDWLATAGVSDLETQEPMKAELQWPIRSITKSFTVTALLQLVDEGKVSLDDTIDQWVEGIPNGDRITLGQLADMTSGVPDYTGDAFIEDFAADPTAPFTREQLLDYVREGEPSAEPGEERRYINASTVLLGEVIEQVEGRGFDEVVETRILEPLGLEGTAYPTDVEGFTADHPTGYQPGDDGLGEPPTNFTVFDTAGAMTSTVDDLLTWGPALATGQLLEPETQRDRLVGSPLVEGPEYDNYATGIGELEGWWGHTGEGFGYTTLVMHNPETSGTVVIVMNVSSLDVHVPTKLFREVATLVT